MMHGWGPTSSEVWMLVIFAVVGLLAIVSGFAWTIAWLVMHVRFV